MLARVNDLNTILLIQYHSVMVPNLFGKQYGLQNERQPFPIEARIARLQSSIEITIQEPWVGQDARGTNLANPKK